MIKVIYDILIAVLLVLSAILIVAIMIQPSKQDTAASAFTGGGDELFERRKARGFEAVMQRFTGVMIGLGYSLGLHSLYYLPDNSRCRKFLLDNV